MSSAKSVTVDSRLSNLRITLVIHSLAGGGAERQISLLAKYLSRAEAQVTLITLDDGLQDTHIIGPEIDRVCLNLMEPSKSKISALLANWRRSQKLKNAVSGSEPDVIISFCDRTNIITLLACRSLGIPMIVSERSDPRQQKLGWIWESLRRISYPACDACVAQTPSVATYLKTLLGKRTVMSVIPSAIEIPANVDVNDAIDKAGKVDSDGRSKKQLIYVGRLSQEKGPDRLLKCWSEIAHRHTDWELVYVGDGPLKEQIEKQALDLRLLNQVRWVGWQKQMEPIWAKADAYVLPSYYEGFPNALLEALWYRIPSIATLCSESIKIIIDHESNGLIAANDNESLQSNLDRLLSERTLREKFVSRSRESVTPFLWDTVSQKWYDLIEKVTTK